VLLACCLEGGVDLLKEVGRGAVAAGWGSGVEELAGAVPLRGLSCCRSGGPIQKLSASQPVGEEPGGVADLAAGAAAGGVVVASRQRPGVEVSYNVLGGPAGDGDVPYGVRDGRQPLSGEEQRPQCDEGCGEGVTGVFGGAGVW
jgi:hypothetical protein